LPQRDGRRRGAVGCPLLEARVGVHVAHDRRDVLGDRVEWRRGRADGSVMSLAWFRSSGVPLNRAIR